MMNKNEKYNKSIFLPKQEIPPYVTKQENNAFKICQTLRKLHRQIPKGFQKPRVVQLFKLFLQLREDRVFKILRKS